MKDVVHIGYLLLLVVLTEQTIVKEKVQYKEVHTDIQLGCIEISGTTRWYYKESETAPYWPITAENGSRYEIPETVIGLTILDSIESDEGMYIVQGDGGLSCLFTLYIHGVFSYNSGVKGTSTGNYEQTVFGADGYSLLAECDYNITGVTDAQDTFVDVDGVIDNINVEDCEYDKYPYCTSCEACFPRLNNPFRQYAIYPNISLSSNTLECRVNLGTYFNGKTIDKDISIRTRTVTAEVIELPYNSQYTLCSNAPGDRNAVIITVLFSNGLVDEQTQYAIQEIPTIVLENDFNISCQNVDNKGFPVTEQIYEYRIQINAIADLPNTREDYFISVCVDDVIHSHTFDCSYQLLGGTSQELEAVEWEIDGNTCSICTESGTNSETNMIELSDLEPYDQSHLLRCFIDINGISYFKEWNIYFDECSTTPTVTTNNTDIPTDIPTDSSAPVNTTTVSVSVTTQLPITEEQTRIIAGIIVGSMLSVIFVVILLILSIILGIILYRYYGLPNSSYPCTPNKPNRYRYIFNHKSQKVRYIKPDDTTITV
ncbi:hypothetical protein LOD99_13939 [Oopsacas minuta]|uniref:Uncharacterized protein n=1 Tax=Oopsacas minuta TaxID=111878 RepID=A0AAV7KGB7_9METZ|nr:hypothetical protein LOD99_13939 [Oopsacas minuta]